MTATLTSPTPLPTAYTGPQRARVILQYLEYCPDRPEQIHADCHGWALIDGDWLWFWDDELGHWQSWPARNVLCVDWGSE